MCIHTANQVFMTNTTEHSAWQLLVKNCHIPAQLPKCIKMINSISPELSFSDAKKTNFVYCFARTTIASVLWKTEYTCIKLIKTTMKNCSWKATEQSKHILFESCHYVDVFIDGHLAGVGKYELFILGTEFTQSLLTLGRFSFQLTVSLTQFQHCNRRDEWSRLSMYRCNISGVFHSLPEPNRAWLLVVYVFTPGHLFC